MITLAKVGRYIAAMRYNDSLRDGCPYCVKNRLTLFSMITGDNMPITGETESQLVLRLNNYNQPNSIIVTNITDDPDYIISTPVPDCPYCSSFSHNEFYTKKDSFIPADNWSSGHFCEERSTKATSFVDDMQNYMGSVGIMTRPTQQQFAPNGISFWNSVQLLSSDITSFEVAGGKGNKESDIIASCVGEGLERYAIAASSCMSNVIASYEDVHSFAVDPIEEWGLPARQESLGIAPYTHQTKIRWIEVEQIRGNNIEHLLVPSDMMLPHSRNGAPCLPVFLGSSNGTAAGSDIQSASIQAMLELIERDAFWFYCRTTASPFAVPCKYIPERILRIMDSNPDIKYIFETLPNPFDIPVVQVLAIDQCSQTAKSARGTGAAFNLSDAIERAFNECNQMITSLRTAARIDSATDMRSIWFSGESEKIFANLFHPVQQERIPDPATVSSDAFSYLTNKFDEQKLNVYRIPLWNTVHSSVVKCIATNIAPCDSTYFTNSNRLEDFAKAMGFNIHRSTYTGSLFM
ncbi:MAG: YcaO-like family protein [Bifidobacterium longum]